MTELYDVITTGNGLALWQFSRSFINYALVTILIISSFATVLRLSLDTYSIKKVLPGLFTGFVLANLSLTICRSLLQISDSLVVTLDGLGLSNTTTIDIMTSGMQGVVVALIGAGFLVSIFGAGVGLLLLAGVALIIILFPTIAWLGILVVLVSRYYVVQYLVAFSPIFFMALGVPFARKWFEKWWGLLLTWIFMKPMAYGLLYLGALIVQAQVGTPLIAYTIGLIAMYSAVILPFRAGGIVNATLAKAAKRLGGSTAVATRGLGAQLAESTNAKIAGIGRGMVGVTELPGSFKEARKKKEANIESMGKLEAAKMRKDKAAVTKLEDGNVAEYAEKYKDLSVPELGLKMANATSEYERAAIMKLAGDKGQRINMYKEYNRHVDPTKQITKAELSDPQKLKEREAKLMGAQIVEKDIEYTDDKGMKQIRKGARVIEGGLAQRYGNRFDEADRKNGIAHLGFRQQTIIDTAGKAHQVASTTQEANEAGSNLFTGAAITVNRNLTAKTATVDGKLSGAFTEALRSGKYNRESVKGSKDENMNSDFMNTVQGNWTENSRILVDLQTDFLSKARAASTTTEREQWEERARVADALHIRFDPSQRDAYNDSIKAL